MRNNFNLQLNELHEDLKKMGTLCEDCITFATQSLLLGDTEFGERAIQAEKQTDIMEKEIQNLCMRILFTHALIIVRQNRYGGKIAYGISRNRE